MVFYLTGSLCGLEKCDALHLRAPTVECIRAREEGRRSISAARKHKARVVLSLFWCVRPPAGLFEQAAAAD